MNVRVQVLFDPPDEDARAAMRSLGRSVTNDPDSVRVLAADDDPDWLVVECTMPTEAQDKAVDKVDRALRWHVWDRLDSMIGFPKSEAERARTRRKTQRRREKRQAARKDTPDG